MLFGLDAWDVALMALAAYISVVTLFRMMHRRREKLVDDLMVQVKIEEKKLQEKKKREMRAKVRDQMRQQNAA